MAVINFDWSYPAIFDPCFDFKGRYILLSGGRSSGKSWFIAHTLLEEAMHERHDILCVREFQSRISESSHKLFKNIVEKYNLPYTVQENKITCNITGSEIIFIGMAGQTAESVKSYEDFDRVFVEEAQKLTVASFVILDPTIRKSNSKIYLGYNPKYKNDVANHIKNLFPTKYLHIHSTYLDNPFSNQDTFDQANSYRANKPQEYNYIWLGKYRELSEDLLCPDYTKDNLISLRYLPSQPLHIACDFNWNPNCWYIAHKDSKTIYYIDEYCKTQSTRKQIKEVLTDYPHNGLIVINGDSSGFQKRSGQDDGCDYDQIEFELIQAGYRRDNIVNKKAGYKKLYRIDVPLANGSRFSRYQAWNDMILDPITGERRILIAPKCEKLIYNLEELKLVPGSADFHVPTATQIGSDDADMLKFLGHPFDSASYMANYYFPVECGLEEKIVKKDVIKEWQNAPEVQG